MCAYSEIVHIGYINIQGPYQGPSGFDLRRKIEATWTSKVPKTGPIWLFL